MRHNDRSFLAVLVATALVLGIAAAELSRVRGADQYFACDGSALNAAKWAISPSGPFNDGFTPGNTAHFTVADGTGKGASITVGGIVATENFTLTAGGLISNQGNPVTIDVASGKTLDFGAQVFTSNASAGYVKNGSGVLAVGSGGNDTKYGGGFTLNAGTVILRGDNGMGGSATGSGASNTLLLNSGTVASTANRDLSSHFGGGITFGGNVQFGDTTGLASSTAGLTFSNNVSLGSSTRTLTLGNSGTTTFSGVISNSGGVGVTFAATAGGTGRFDLTNTANAYSGTTTITGGEVRISDDGSLGATPGSITANSIILDGGRLSTANNASITLNSNRGIQVGSTSGSSISVTGSGTLTYGGIIADKSGSAGTWTKDGAGALSLGGVSTYTGSLRIGAGTVTVNSGGSLGSGALIMGADSGTSSVTLNLNNSAQTTGSLSEGSANVTRTINLGSNHTLTVNQTTAGTYSGTITGDSTSKLILGSSSTNSLTLSGSNTYAGGTDINSGTLYVSNSSGSAVGSGAVSVNSGGKLGGHNAGAISGSVAVSGGGRLAPGFSTNNGVLKVNNGVTFSSSSANFDIRANGNSVGTGSNATGYDQLSVTGGTVTLNNATLNFTVGGSYTPTTSDLLVIINNSGGNAIVGKFSNTNADDTFASGGFNWKVYYNVSATDITQSGNNVVIALSPVPEPASIIAVCVGGVAVYAGARRWRRRRAAGNQFAAS